MESQECTSFEAPEDFCRLLGLKFWSYEKALSKKVVFVGLGGVGAPIVETLARVGIEHIVLIDPDRVEVKNLNRVGYSAEDVGLLKVEALKRRIERMFKNHRVYIEAIPENVTDIDLNSIMSDADLVVSSPDSIVARLFVNDVCVEERVPLVDTGFTIDGLRGHVRVIIPGETACLRCTYFELPDSKNTKAAEMVDLKKKTGYAISPAPTLMVLSSLASLMAFNVLFTKREFPNYISVYVPEMRFLSIELKRNPNCEVCSGLDS